MSAQGRSVVGSPDALADLDAIWDYYARVAGSTTADKIVRAVGAAIEVIAAHPLAGRERSARRKGMRMLESDH